MPRAEARLAHMRFSLEIRPALPPTSLAPEEGARAAKAAAVLALLTFIIFLPVVEFGWVNYDDDVFVTNNEHVAPGLKWAGIKWAFTSADIDYWRPLSWLSHMLDVELYGSVAGGHHLSNLLIHCAGAAMALFALHRLTRQFWPSCLVAALFAIHPLHVESVAWIAERKDVLCGFFFWAALWCYAAYVSAPSTVAYLRVFLAFLLGIMSKPMIVTLPCLLLLLDYWPLRRISFEGRDWRGILRDAWPLVREKLPLFALVAVLTFSTVYSQHRVGAMADLTGLPLPFRLQNALTAYVTYLTQMFLPVNLCILYPMDYQLSVLRWGVALLPLLLITGLCLWRARRQPWLIVGWLWFLGVLVPVIGLVQVGEQAHADRYTYLPLNGLFLMLVWSVAAWIAADARRKRGASLLMVVVLLACAGITRTQLSHWQDGLAAFGQALAVTRNNATALNNYGNALRSRGQTRAAIPYFADSARIKQSQNALLNLGFSHLELGEDLVGMAYLRRAFALDPYGANAKDAYAITARDGLASQDPIYAKVLAVAQAVRGRYDESVKHLERAAQLAPRDAGILLDQAAYLAMARREVEAVEVLKRALELAPGNLAAQANLAALLAKQGNLEAALKLNERTLAADPNNYRTRHNYALLLARSGRVAEARAEFERVLTTDASFWPTLQQLAWLLATRPAVRDPAAALKHAGRAATLVGPRSPSMLDVLAAAEAANGNFELAVTLATRALALMPPGKDAELRTAIETRLAGYRLKRMHDE